MRTSGRRVACDGCSVLGDQRIIGKNGEIDAIAHIGERGIEGALLVVEAVDDTPAAAFFLDE